MKYNHEFGECDPNDQGTGTVGDCAKLSGEFKKGAKIVYNDGRPGHSSAVASVLCVDNKGMMVHFEDRADTTYITFAERRWMDYIELAD